MSDHTVPTCLIVLMLILSLGGFADSAYLTAKHYTGGPVPCSITGGCEDVMTSRYATLGPIPTAGFGAAYYLVAFFLLIFFLDSRRPTVLTAVLALSSAALVVSLVLLYLMAFVIKAFCQYCLLSDLLTTALFATSLAVVLRARRTTNSEIRPAEGVSSRGA